MSELQDADPFLDEPTKTLAPDPRRSDLAEAAGWPEQPRTMPAYREALPGQVVLIPGLGLGPRLFEPQRRAYGERIVTPNWLEPEPNEALSHYARRWGEALTKQVDPDQPLFLGGASLGGMIALEMAEVLHPRAVFLIGSCADHHEVPLRLQLLSTLAGHLPAGVIGRLLPAAAIGFACREGLDDRHFARVRRLIREADPAFFRWAATAIHDWDYTGPPEEAPYAVYRLHGRQDWLMPPRSGAVPIDKEVFDGRHLINLTHARTINRFIADRCWAHLTEQDDPGPRYRYY